MSKDENNSVATTGKETRNALLVGLLLLLLLILAPLYWVERAQQDLTDRSRGALRRGGMDPNAFEIGFDGRDARLVGSQSQAAQLAEARRLIEQVWGVRTVSTRATAPGSEAPAGTTLTAAAGPTALASAGGAVQPAANDSPPPEPTMAAPKPTAASAGPVPKQPRKPAPQPTELAAAEELPATQTPAAASEPPGAEAIASETTGPATTAPVTETTAAQGPTTTGTAIADREAPAEPAAEGPAREEPQAATTSTRPEKPDASASAAPMETPPAPAPRTPAAKSGVAEAATPESEQKPVPEAALVAADGEIRAVPGEISADALLTDWPDLAAVEDLRLEMEHNQVWLRGQVNSLADLKRIEAQFPDSAAGRHVRLDLQLARRTSQELADHLNLVAASFRFRPGTSHFGPSGERAMDRIAGTLKSYPGMRLGLAGRAPESLNPRVRRVHARHRAGATYRALLTRGVDGQQLFLADFASPFPPLLSYIPVAPSGPGQIQFFSLER